MADLRINIDGGDLDLFPQTDDVFYITRQIYDLSNLQTRNADFTREISVPATENNIFLLNIVNFHDVADIAGGKRIECNIILDGVSVAINASLIVKDVTNRRAVSLTIFYGNYALFDGIQGTLRTLDLTQYGFEYSLDGILGFEQHAGTNITQGGFARITFDVAPVPAPVVGDLVTLESGDYDKIIGKITTVQSATVYDTDITFAGAGGAVAIFVQTGTNRTTQTEGVVYALGDWFAPLSTISLASSDSIRKKQDIELSGFFIYAKTILKQIFAEAGFVLDDSQITDPLYDELLISCPNFLFVLQSSSTETEERQRNTVNQLVSGDGGTTTENIIWAFPISQWSEVITWQGVTNDFLWIGPTTDIFFRVLILYTSDIDQGTSINFSFRVNDVAIAEETIIIDHLTVFSSILEGTTTVTTNDIISTQVIATVGAGNNFAACELFQQDAFLINSASIVILGAGAEVNRNIINPASFLTENLRSSFTKGIFNMLGLVVETNTLDSNAVIKKFDDIQTSEEQNIRLDISKDFKETSLTGFFQNNLFLYVEENFPELFRTDENAVIAVDDERLIKSGVVIQLPFNASDSSSMLNYNRTASLPVANSSSLGFTREPLDPESVQWDEGTSVFTNTTAVTFEIGQYLGLGVDFHRITKIVTDTTGEIAGKWNSVKGSLTGDAFIMTFIITGQINKIARRLAPQQTDINYWLAQGFFNHFNNDNETIEKVGVEVVGGFETTFDTPMLWNTLITNNYKAISKAVTHPLILQVWAIFTPTEFLTLDLLRPVYLEAPFSGLFYINKIEQFKVSSPTRLTLVRI